MAVGAGRGGCSPARRPRTSSWRPPRATGCVWANYGSSGVAARRLHLTDHHRRGRADKQLYEWYGDRVRFVDIADPAGPPRRASGAYRNHEEMLADARAYKRDEGSNGRCWPTTTGRVHRTFSREMADPSFLIDSEGRVAFYCMWTHAPTPEEGHRRVARTGRSRGSGGRRHRSEAHLFASFVDGYRGISRGGKRGVREYITGGLGARILTILGNKAKPVLAPIALRAALPPGGEARLLGGLAAAARWGRGRCCATRPLGRAGAARHLRPRGPRASPRFWTTRNRGRPAAPARTDLASASVQTPKEDPMRPEVEPRVAGGLRRVSGPAAESGGAGARRRGLDGSGLPLPVRRHKAPARPAPARLRLGQSGRGTRGVLLVPSPRRPDRSRLLRRYAGPRRDGQGEPA